ncbi:unnamed protein product [Closterium sp. NIES-54]
MLVLLLSLPILVSAAVVPPTTAQIILELKDLQSKLAKNPFLRYLGMSQVISQLIVQGETVPASIDWSPFAYNTLLIPTDAALSASGLLVQPTTPEQALSLFKSVSYNIIKGMKPFSQLKALAVGKTVTLLLNNGKLFRQKVNPGWGINQGTAVAFALKGKNKTEWSKILDKDIHKGSSFIAHGVNRLQTTGAAAGA